MFAQFRSQLSDGARMCSDETDTLLTTNSNLAAAYDNVFDNVVVNADSCQISDSFDVECTIDFGPSSGGVITACSAANGKFATMNYGLDCTLDITVEGESISSSVNSAANNFPFCLHESCDSEELTEIMAGLADTSVGALQDNTFASFEGYDIQVDCTYTVDVFLDQTPVFASSRSASDSGSFLRSAQGGGSGGANAKLTTSAFIATAGLAIAAIV